MLNVTHINLNILSMEVLLFSIFAMQGPPLKASESLLESWSVAKVVSIKLLGSKDIWNEKVDVAAW